MNKDEIDIIEIYEAVGQRIDEWLDKYLTFENGCKRKWEEGDYFYEEEVLYILTKKGSRLYNNYLRRAEKIILNKYPNDLLEDLSSYTSIYNP